MGENIFRDINKDLTEEDILMLSPVQLAYIGDAVYELMIRTNILNRGKSVNEMHKSSTLYAKAEGQSEVVHELDSFFTEKEKQIIRRGRNAKSKSSSKNSNIIDYKYATGFEAMIGYLYLNREYSRLGEIFEEIKMTFNRKTKDK